MSYKESKYLTHYNNISIFKYLVTSTNELDEIKMQFYVVTNSHNQIDSVIKAYKNICDIYSHHYSKHIFTDNSCRD